MKLIILKGIKTLRRYNNIKKARVQINIKGYNDADKNKGGLLPDSFLLPPILNNRENSKRIEHNFKKRLGGAYTTWSS